MTIPANGTPCTTCNELGHFCQARCTQDGKPLCFDCADGEECFFKRKQKRLAVQAIEERPCKVCGKPVSPSSWSIGNRRCHRKECRASASSKSSAAAIKAEYAPSSEPKVAEDAYTPLSIEDAVDIIQRADAVVIPAIAEPKPEPKPSVTITIPIAAADAFLLALSPTEKAEIMQQVIARWE